MTFGLQLQLLSSLHAGQCLRTEAKPSLSVSELVLFVVTFVHIIVSLSRNQMFLKLLPLVFGIRDGRVS
jgi:hypothetical protein